MPPYIWELIMLQSILGHPGYLPWPQASNTYWHSNSGSLYKDWQARPSFSTPQSVSCHFSGPLHQLTIHFFTL